MTVRRENFAEITMELIESKCIEDGGCLIWQYGSAHGAPYMSFQRKSVAVRRWVAENILGKDVNKRIVTSSCMNKMCVCPDHLAVVTRAKMQKMWADHLQYGKNPVRRQKLVDAARKRFGYDIELRDRVMLDPRSQKVIAKEIGKSQDFVAAIKNGTSYRDLSNPFAGLMR
jgi:hypothetical protein